MNGNITLDGAIKDIEWMYRIGLAGFQTFDAALTTPQVLENRISYMTDPWKEVFRTITAKADELGAPGQTVFENLTDWTAHPDKYIQYYSGTAVYSKELELTEEETGGKVWLNLGSVKNLAEVTVNGRQLGILWKAPFRVDISAAVLPGKNTIEVKVVNLWVNRMIGDQR